jgi:hypothetical protein
MNRQVRLDRSNHPEIPVSSRRRPQGKDSHEG